MPSSSVGGPQPGEARQGRHKQRYGANGERLVAGCIPVRFSGNGGGAQDVEVLLISSRGGKGFCFPKGGWEDDESVEAAAKRETVEEAGVRGSVEEPMLGAFAFSSGKLSTDMVTRQGYIAHMFVLHVAEELAVWPEGHERSRCWCPLSEASARCRYDWMRQALHVWIQRRGWLPLLEEPTSLRQQPSEMVSSSSGVSLSDRSESVDTFRGRPLAHIGSTGSVRGASPPASISFHELS